MTTDNTPIHFLKVLLPLKLDWTPWYKTSSDSLVRGDRVRVLFSGKQYVGVVTEMDGIPDIPSDRIQNILSEDCGFEPVTEEELRLWQFISSYYLCTMGEVYHCAYPSTRVRSEEVRVRVQDRRLSQAHKTIELLEKRIALLTERLRKKEEDLQRGHKESVQRRLEEERGRIEENLSKAVSALQSVRLRMQESSPHINCNHASSILEEKLPRVKEAPFSVRFGKYEQLIRHTLDSGMSTLLLVPEITLTEELESAMERVAGDSMVVFHSQETVSQRRKIADRVRSGESVLVVGTRSAVFLPFVNLGLVIVEEEQDASYKQIEPAPRYNARDVAVMMGGIHGAAVVLGTSAPSLETFLNCEVGRYRRMEESTSRFADTELIDPSAERLKKGMVGTFSRKALALIDSYLSRGEKIAILRSWTDVAGELDSLFGNRSGQIDILPLWKLSNMEAYHLIVVPQADSLFGKDDFRSDEKAFQTLMRLSDSVSVHDDGLLVVQTQRTDHPVLQALSAGDSRGLYLRLLEERKAFRYPPFTRMVDVVFDDANEARLGKLFAEFTSFMGAGYAILALKPVVHICLEKNHELQSAKNEIMSQVGAFEKKYHYLGHIFVDSDPL